MESMMLGLKMIKRASSHKIAANLSVVYSFLNMIV